MKRLLLCATALMFSATAANAGCGSGVTCLFEMPKDMRGSWCMTNDRSPSLYFAHVELARARCDQPLTIDRDGYRLLGGEIECG